MKSGFVPATTFIAVNENNDVIGMINIRHRLNDYLANFGRQIGYGVIKSQRRKGVATNVLSYHIVGGNPIRIIKPRFDDELINYLLDIKWWDWSQEKIFNNLDVLCSADLERVKSIVK